MAIVQTLTTSFKREILCGFHAFDSEYRTSDNFYLALYNAPTVLDSTITAYTSVNEVVDPNNIYLPGGQLLAPLTPATSGTTAFLSFNNAVWSGGAFTTNCGLIYNQSQGNRSVCVLSFGNNKTSNSQTFTISFPANSATTALIIIS